MPTSLQFRGFDTASTNSFTGAVKEITVDTTKDVVVVHDGVTAGGFAAAARANVDGSISLINRAGGVPATVSASGNLGLGVTPSAWGETHRAIDIAGSTAAHIVAYVNNIFLGRNYYDDGFGPRYAFSGQPAQRMGMTTGGLFSWELAPSGTVGSPISFTPAMTLTNAGNLLVGTTTDQLSTIVSDSVGRTYSYVGLDNGTQTYRVLANGNVQNTNNIYGAISDAKLKENVTDATPKLADLNQLRVVNYNLIGSELKQIGLIAQEVEQVFPGLVESTPDTVEVTKTREVPEVRDDEGNVVTEATTETYTEREPNGEVTKSVKYSILVPMLLKAMQEQQSMIEDLTSRIAALENQ